MSFVNFKPVNYLNFNIPKPESLDKELQSVRSVE